MSKSEQALDNYIKFIQAAQNRPIPQGPIENHHILPLSLTKDDKEWFDRNNKLTVALTPEEHYIAHELLKDAFPEDKKLQNAFKYFRSMTKSINKEPSPENYALARARIRKKVSKKIKGRTKETHEYLRINGENITGSLHPNYDTTIYVLGKRNNPTEIYIGTRYNIINQLNLNKSHLSRHINWIVHGIPESGAVTHRGRKTVAGYYIIGAINSDELQSDVVNITI